MKTILTICTVATMLFFLMHEFDAFHRQEWRMFKFLRRFRERTQYLVFLYAHFPLCAFIGYYLYCTFQFTAKPMWLIVNAFLVVHLIIHLIAARWKSNVFKQAASYIMIGGMALFGLVNLILQSYY